MSTQKPTDTDRTCGMVSVTSRTPGTGSDRSNGTAGLLLVAAGSVAAHVGADLGDLGRHEVELSVRTDLVDLHRQAVADTDDVLDLVDALAAGELRQLRDVNEAVLARHDVHK